jgi:hypothetical protein
MFLCPVWSLISKLKDDIHSLGYTSVPCLMFIQQRFLKILSSQHILTCISSLIVCLFVCFESHEQFSSYLATVTITGDGATNLDLCLALTAFSREGYFTCHTYCDTGPPFLRSYPKGPWFYLLNAVLLAKGQSLPILHSISNAKISSQN